MSQVIGKASFLVEFTSSGTTKIKSGMFHACNADPQFPLKLWKKLIPQVETALNHLRPSRINPILLSYAQMYSNFDFNRTPIAPPDLKVLAYI